MPSIIQLKTGTGSAVPSALVQGEVAINVDNGLWYYGSGSGQDVKKLESFTDITASGNISSSGELSALTVSDVLAAAVVTQIDNDEIPIAKLAEDAVTVTAGTGLTGGGSITLGGSATVNVIGGTGVTANANDVAIGQDVATTANVLFNHISASGNISASGRIYGRQFEQIETNFAENFSSRGVVYMPFSNQSISDNTNSSNINVNRVAAVPGKPVKSVIRAISNTLGDNAQYTMSYWEAAAGDPTNPILKSAAYAITDSDSNKDAIIFDFTDPGSGSTTDVAVGSRIWMTLEAEGTGNGSFIVTHVWEWDYNSIM